MHSLPRTKKISPWLPLAEWWYNTNFHTSSKTTPFEALYGYPPPIIYEILLPGPESPALDFLQQKQHMINKLKDNLAQAQARMKKYADKNILDREFKVRDMVYLKLQPFRFNAFGLHQSLKLTTNTMAPSRSSKKWVLLPISSSFLDQLTSTLFSMSIN
jgi:hypothetical protein